MVWVFVSTPGRSAAETDNFRSIHTVLTPRRENLVRIGDVVCVMDTNRNRWGPGRRTRNTCENSTLQALLKDLDQFDDYNVTRLDTLISEETSRQRSSRIGVGGLQAGSTESIFQTTKAAKSNMSTAQEKDH
ncbi:hypothetical protein CCR75_005162 [Bremia lactucae]|uniref:Uncharacterized protein n=1 Tax=Bremia lactucae TaxID=4779 RepID=A0A976IBV9_BRELC|nr:hypothetical protein CCR75_005162 [Bremia lactucae]